MKKKALIKFLIFSILFPVLNPVLLSGQNKADYYFNNQRFGEALPLYLHLLGSDSSNPGLNFKIGKCYLESRSHKEKATPFLEKAVNFISSESSVDFDLTSAPLIAFKYLGDVYLLTRKFDQAKKSYEIFSSNFSCNSVNSFFLPPLNLHKANICKEVNRKIEMTSFGKEISGSIDCPFISEKDNKFFEEMLIPADIPMEAAVSIDSNKIPVEYEATVATSTDGQVILIYKNVGGNAELYTTVLTENKWTSHEKLNKTINDAGWEMNECVSPDGSVMYFTSSRPEGYGGKDIYSCKKLPSGEWGKAKNLGAVINTPYDEEAPFICPDGSTLFFSSNKNHKVEFEVFTSNLSGDETFGANPRQTDESVLRLTSSGPTKSTDSVFHRSGWTEPVNSGFPVISTEDVANDKPDVITAAITSPAPMEKSEPVVNLQKNEDVRMPNSPNHEGNKKVPMNNYLVSFYNHEKKPLIIFKGQIADINGNIPGQVKISITDNESGKIMGMYFIDNSGKYSLILPDEKNINVTFEAEGYLFHSENFDLTKDSWFFEIIKPVMLVPVIAGYGIVLNNIFFEKNKANFSMFSIPELACLLNFLKNNSAVTVEISYVIDSDKKTRTINAELAQKRANAIVNFLFENGIAKERMFSRGYGKLSKGKAAGCELKVIAN